MTGTRAEFGLLRSTMRAIAGDPHLELCVIVTGMHLVGSDPTVSDVVAEFEVSAQVPMQTDEHTGRAADVEAMGRGIQGLGPAFDAVSADVVLVLGDRIEAFAAASAASIGGRLVAHVHGGDRAEGVADEAMRHAITKLAHLHFAATEQSAGRIRSLGEDPKWVYVTGSPAIDGLDRIEFATDEALHARGVDPTRPFIVVLQHPSGLDPTTERETMASILATTDGAVAGNVMVLAPNHDPGRDDVLAAMGHRTLITHLPRPQFIGVLRRAACLIGNSSAGLIEAAALGVPVVNVGPRQSGRERAGNVIDVADASRDGLRRALEEALMRSRDTAHPYGDGHAGARIASILASMSDGPRPSIRKRCVY